MLTEKEISVLNQLEEDISYENYFFKKVRNLKWFLHLKEKDYFKPKKVPELIHDKEGKYYSIPEWNVLPYLEKVSEQVNLPGNERYVDELLEIIKDVSTAADITDNYRTWWYFVKILINIPREKIPVDVIELIPVWLDSKFDASHVGSEIGLKLLPKFLSDKPSEGDATKAEKIVEYITAYKAVKLDEERAKLLEKEEELKLVTGSYWVKKIFEKRSRDIGEKCKNDIVYALSERIRFLLKKDESKIPIESGDKTYLLTLSSENNKYSVKVFKIPTTSKSNIYEYLLRTKRIDGPSLNNLSVDETSMEGFIIKVFDGLAMNPPFSEMDEAVLKKDIYHLYRNFHDQGTYCSFFNETRDHLTEPLEELTFVLKNILMARAGKHVDKTKEILNKFFKDKYFYFPKIALNIIGNNIANYEDVFWDVLDGESGFFFYESTYFGDELRNLLEGLHSLSPEHKERLKTIIAEGPQKKIGEKDGEYILKWKQERYHALIKDPDFKELYDSLKSQTGRDVSLKAAVGEIRVRSGEGPAPLTKEEIFRMSNEKLVEYLRTFKSKGFWEGGPTVGGLARLIKECAAEQPGKFVDDLSSFIDTGFIYIYEILDGIREALNRKQDIAWGKLFDFMKRYIGRNEFWEDWFIVEKDDFLGGATHLWIVGAMAELIEKGTKDDSRAYSEEHFDIAENIISLILDKLEIEEEKDITDYVSHTINTAYGKTIIALINHTLLIARFNAKKDIKKEEIKWSKEIKRKYDDLLKKNIIESYTLLGRYLPNLFYLDKTWAEEKVRLLHPKAENDNWEAFMNGYLSIGKVYDDLYKLIIPHYQYAITHEFKEKRDNEHLVQQIALGYLFGFAEENIDNTESLFRKVLDAWNPEQILNIVGFFWSHQKNIGDEKEESNKIVKKIIFLWKWVYQNKYQNKPESEITDHDKKILSAFAMLTVFLPNINKEYSEWLMLAAPYANEDYNSSFFVEYLNKFDDSESIGYAGKIFLKMLDHFIPDFDHGHIRSIVEKLYINKHKKDADEICDIHGRAGYDFLRDLYERHNKTE